MVAGTLGGLLTTWVTFTPCFLWIFVGAPFVEMLRANKALSSALSTITAAVVGVILNLAIWFALHVLFGRLVPVHWLGMSADMPVMASINVPSLVLTAGAVIGVFRFGAGMIPVLAVCSVAGVAWDLLGGMS
jgi:chromate transporter